MTPTDAHAQIDTDGWLDAAQGAAVYALRLTIPAYPRAAWADAFDAPPPDDFEARLRAADRLVYVGESADAYGRIMDHARGDVRQTAIMRVCEPERVVGVWPVDGDRSAAEYNTAARLADGSTAVWCNGALR